MNKELIQKFAALGSLSLLLLVFSLTSNAFFAVSNGMSVALQVTSIAYLGIAATCVIIAGGIDLSSGSVQALAGVAAALGADTAGVVASPAATTQAIADRLKAAPLGRVLLGVVAPAHAGLQPAAQAGGEHRRCR